MTEEFDNMAPDEDLDTPPQLIFGKYKSIEEAEAAYKESERKMADESMRADRAERLIDLFKPEHTQESTTDEYPSNEAAGVDETAFDDEQKRYLAAVVQQSNEQKESEFMGKMGKILSAREQQAMQKKLFYQENPDLVGYEDDVAIEANNLVANPRSNSLDAASARAELSKMVKSRLDRISKRMNTRENFHPAEGASSTETFNEPTENEDDPNPEKILNDYVKDVRARRNKKQTFRG